MKIIDKIKEIIFKIKDYDRLESDYCELLDIATGGMMSYPNYTMESVYRGVDEEWKRRDDNLIEDRWHDVSKEMPTSFGSEVLVLCKNKNKPDGIWLCDLIQCWEGVWEPRENYEKPIKWAYLDDFLPKNKEIEI